MNRYLLALTAATLVVIPTRALTAQASEEEPPLRMLVVNDDGYQSPGLVALVDSLVTVGTIAVAAPLEQQSGTGHGITYREPIRILEMGNQYAIKWYAVDAKPATVVKVALNSLLDTMPDLVVSGVNTGDNIGTHVWISGTVAAARDAALQGYPAIAASVSYGNPLDFRVAAGYVKQLVLQLQNAGALEPGLLLNVNVPSGGPEAIQGVVVREQSLEMGTQRYEERYSPRGSRYVWDVW
ncbi:MAG: 5'/3'-nucleotidase SurE, partial [Gemmatimonadales bacterium]